MSNQLIKETALGTEKVFPKNYILNLVDKDSGKTLELILNSFNMLFLSYLGNKADTRKLVPMSLRKLGLWITYVIGKTTVTEWYNSNAIDDTTWGLSTYWRLGSNMLVGDIAISANGTWVVNGEDTGISPKGDKGDSPIIRVYNNKLLVSYDKGNTYIDLNNTPVFTLFRFNSNTNTHLVSYDLGLTWLDVLPDKVYYKFKYNESTNTYQVSTDFGKTWSNVSAEKVYYKFRYNPSTNTHLVSTDLGSNWVDISTEKVFYKFRTNENKLLVSTDLGTTWEDCSEPIAAWFRWAGGDTADSIGKLLISRDLQKTWTDLSPNITNNLRIKGYVAAVGNLPSDASLGDIYMVGPTYDESDTTHDYPHYRMWVKLSSGWVDNGEYLSNVLISLTIGLETGITMSLKAITDIAKQGIYDVSANNGGAVFESLSALLNDTNLSTLIPTSVRCGGMSIRFIQGTVSNSDNKYVQWRLIKNQWSVDVKDWFNDSENIKNLTDEVGEFLLCDKVVSYSANPSAWESTRRFVDISYDFMADSLIKYKNECAYTAHVRVTYSDNSQVIYDISANSEGTISIEHNNLAIKIIVCYFVASDHAENNVKLILLQSIGKRLNNVEMLAQKTAPALGYANGTVFVSCDSADFVNRFFKELYIVPLYPELFDINAIKSISIYRGWNSGTSWQVSFHSQDGSVLASINSTTNIEGKEIIELVPSITNNRFIGYAVLDWSQMPDAPSRIYQYACTLNKISTNLKYNPILNTWFSRNDNIYKLPNWEYASLFDAAKDVKQRNIYDTDFDYSDRTKKGIMLRFFNTTTGNVELWLFNYEGEHPEYQVNFCNRNNWILVADNSIWTDAVSLVEPQLVKLSQYSMSANGTISFESGNFMERIRYASVKRGDIIKITLTNHWGMSGTIRMTTYDTIPEDGLSKISVADVVTDTIATGETTTLIYRCKYDGYFCIYGYGLDHSEYFDYMSYTIEYCRTIKDIIERDAHKWEKASKLVSEPTNEMIIASHSGLAISGRTSGSPRAWLYASQFGYKWMECDIRFTSDNVAVFLHDEPINALGNYIVNKSTGVPVASSDNLKVKNLTLSQLQGTYRWADGGNILTLVEGFGLLNMLGMNCRLEFKDVPSNKAQKDYLKNACMEFGIGRIVYNATSTPYETIFDMLVELGIYKKGTVAVAASSVDDKVENAFKYARELGNAAVGVYSPNSTYTLDSVFIQNMLSKYGVRWSDGQWGKNTKYQTVEIVSNYIAPCLEHYANTELLINGDDIDYNDYTSIGTFTLQSDANVNICMIADSDVSIKINTKDDEFYGNTNIAICLASGTYTLLAKGEGHITELMIRF